MIFLGIVFILVHQLSDAMLSIKRMSILLFAIGLCGCVSYKAVGKLEDRSEIFVGNVAHNLMGGGGKVEFSGVNS